MLVSAVILNGTITVPDVLSDGNWVRSDQDLLDGSNFYEEGIFIPNNVTSKTLYRAKELPTIYVTLGTLINANGDCQFVFAAPTGLNDVNIKGNIFTDDIVDGDWEHVERYRFLSHVYPNKSTIDKLLILHKLHKDVPEVYTTYNAKALLKAWEKFPNKPVGLVGFHRNRK